MGNSSWADRSQSMVVGFELLVQGDFATLLFGLGPGMTAPLLWSIHRLDAVWSVVLAYIYETGLMGAIAVTAIGWMLFQTWRKSGWSVVLAGLTFVWLIGVVITTSYAQLLPIWIAMGWLSVWNSVCEPAPRRRKAIAAPEVTMGSMQIRRKARTGSVNNGWRRRAVSSGWAMDRRWTS